MQSRARTWNLSGDPMQRCRERQLPLNGPSGSAISGSTLSLDFTAMSGVLDPLITFSRADSTARATFINSSGYVETVPVGQPQAPRFTFSETSIGTPRGLLLEAPSTNLLRFSAYPDSGWNVYGSFLRPTPYVFVTSPANDSTATELNFTLTTNGMFTNAGLMGYTNSIGSTYTLSIWLRAIPGPGGTANASLRFSDSATGLSLTTVSFTTTWARYQVQFTNAVTNSGPAMQSASGTATGRFECWGAQLELGAQPSSYIPTLSAALTRAVDTAIIAAGTNFSSWYTGGTTGTFVTEWCRCSPTTTQRTVIATSDVDNRHLHQYIAATTSRLRLANRVPLFIETTNASVDNSINKGAFSYAGSVQSLCLNGGTVVPGTLAFTTAPTWLSIGGPSTNGTTITDTAVLLNNAIRSIKYFPTRLSDADIQTLTTL